MYRVSIALLGIKKHIFRDYTDSSMKGNLLDSYPTEAPISLAWEEETIGEENTVQPIPVGLCIVHSRCCGEAYNLPL